MDLNALLRRPLVPRADNFTPRERTPWGGTRIAGQYKSWLGLPRDLVVGESWEISAHPSFPSRFETGGGAAVTLPELLAHDASAVLGARVAEAYQGRLPVLIKWLDAADNLSVQVHPDDHHPGLRPGEMGKTEAWLVVDAAPGAGLYLGLRQDVTAPGLRAALEGGEDISGFLNFVPGRPGDMYFIPAGTIHAIGRGMTLIEPQQTSETTYRFWDWNRRYDAAGRLDPAGMPRSLHVDESFAVADFSGPRDQAFVESIRCRETLVRRAGGHQEHRLLSVPQFQVSRLDLGTGDPLPVDLGDQFLALTLLAGSAELSFSGPGGPESLTLPAGQSVLLPAALAACGLRAAGDSPARCVAVGLPPLT